jgi:hypothetical protein
VNPVEDQAEALEIGGCPGLVDFTSLTDVQASFVDRKGADFSV